MGPFDTSSRFSPGTKGRQTGPRGNGRRRSAWAFAGAAPLLALLWWLGLAGSPAAAAPVGVAPTPPLWWDSFWDLEALGIDLTDAGVRAVAAKWHTNGMQAAGWNIIWLDAGWQQASRDTNGFFEPNATNFPSGLLSLTAYLHGLGFNAGIYTSYGPLACDGLPGTDDAHIFSDVAWFASQGFDALKVDACNESTTPDYLERLTGLFSDAIEACGRDMLLLYTVNTSLPDMDYSIPRQCAGQANVWQDAQAGGSTLPGLVALATFYSQTNGWAQSPGHYGEITSFQPAWTTNLLAAYVSFSAALGAAMEMCDSSLPPDPYPWLTNAEVIAINQDPAAICGTMLWSNNLLEMWSRPLGSLTSATNAVLAVNLAATNQTVGLPILMLYPAGTPVGLRDVWGGTSLGLATNYWTNTIAPGGVILARTWNQSAANEPIMPGPARNARQVTFSYLSTPGYTNAVQYTDSLSPPLWETLTNVPGDGTIKVILDPNATNAMRFYRVAL